jgi:hypothetical protein
VSNRLPWILLVVVTGIASAAIVYLVMRPAGAPATVANPRIEVTSTPAVTAEPTTQPPPTGTATRVPTPTVTATPQATPAPTPVTISMPKPSSGDSSVSGEHKGLLGIVFAAAISRADASSGRIHVSAVIPTAGSGEHPTATGRLDRPFTVPAALGTRVQVQASGSVAWSGTLAGNGVAGAGADIEVVLKLMDGSRVVTQAAVHSKEVRESAMSVGGLRDTGSGTPTLSAAVPGGRGYTLRLEAQCSATSGAISASTHCVFGPSDVYPDGYVEWRNFSVQLTP